MSPVRRRVQEKNVSKEEKRQNNKKTEDTSATLCFTRAFFYLFSGLFGLFTGICLIGYLRAPFTAQVTEPLPFVDFVGPFSINQRLTNGIKINIAAPESVVEDEAGNVYATLIDGRIVRIAPSDEGSPAEGAIETLAKIEFSKDTVRSVHDKTSARPLGMRLFNRTLYVAEAFSGIYSVNMKKGDVSLLVSISDVQPEMKFPDDLVLTKDGKLLYFSDASATYTIDNVVYMLLEGKCDGRIFEYNTRTKTLSVVLNGLCFPNGVELTNDEKYLIVAESLGSRMIIVDRSTWKTKHTTLLRGFPDNVRANSKGTYWIAASAVHENDVSLLKAYPILRQIISGLVPMKQIIQSIQSRHNILYEMTADGEILQALHDPNGTLTTGLTQATELSDGRLALGTYYGKSLAILNQKDSTPIGVR